MKEKIKKQLFENLHPSFLEVVDNSALHIGHAGVDKNFDTHFLVRIGGGDIKGLSLIKSHRLINKVLSNFFAQGIHSIQIEIIK